jgi:hypothetical protein
MNEKHQQFNLLRKEALEEARKVLGPKLYHKKRSGAHTYNKQELTRYESVLHKLMNIDEIDFYVQNNLSIEELYKRDGSKYGKRTTDEDLQEMWDGEELE